jgi:hypothetical protein
MKSLEIIIEFNIFERLSTNRGYDRHRYFYRGTVNVKFSPTDWMT